MTKTEVKISMEKHNKYLTELIGKETANPSIKTLNAAFKINNKVIEAIMASKDGEVNNDAIKEIEEIYNNTRWLKKYTRIRGLAAKALRELKSLKPTKKYCFIDTMNNITGEVEGENRCAARHEAKIYVEKTYNVKCDMAKIRIIGE